MDEIEVTEVLLKDGSTKRFENSPDVRAFDSGVLRVMLEGSGCYLYAPGEWRAVHVFMYDPEE
jgi:hypothetical protein